MADLAPVLGPAIRRTLQRHDSLVRRCRLESDDVVQRVFERMLASPPNNPGAQEAASVLIAWARAVAINYLLDLARRVGRESAVASGELDSAIRSRMRWDTQPVLRKKRAASDRGAVATRAALRRHRARPPQASPRAVLRDRRGARARCSRPRSSDWSSCRAPQRPLHLDEAAARRAEQYVWKLRERVLERKLADYFEVSSDPEVRNDVLVR